MPIPRLPATHQSASDNRKGFHPNINNAITAPTWNAPMKKVVVQFMGRVNVMSRLVAVVIQISFETEMNSVLIIKTSTGVKIAL
jgi:hypothetical protein